MQETPATLGFTFSRSHGVPLCEVPVKLGEVEFLYMDDWAAFASSCCCRDRNHTIDGAVVPEHTELWTCPDFSPQNASGSGILHKQRLRKAEATRPDGSRANGLHIRAFCAPAFAPGFSLPAYDESLQAFVVREEGGALPESYELW
mgnify:CR=1 FL=1